MANSASAPIVSFPSRYVPILQISLLGGVVAGWMGVIEMLLRWQSYWQPVSALSEAVVEHSLLGILLGTGVGALLNFAQAPDRLTPRNPFCIVAIITGVLLFQLSGSATLSWVPQAWTRGARTAVIVWGMGLVPATLIVIGAWFRWVRGVSERRIPLTLRAGSIAGAALAVIALSPAVIPNQVPTGEAAAAKLPNVLLIVLDTTRANRLSAFGYERPTSPTLEAMASEGVLFSRAYSAAPWTLPSHASMFTGKHPSQHGATGEHRSLDDRLPTLAERLSKRGFESVAVFTQPWLRSEVGLMRGFQHSYELLRIRETTGLHFFFETLIHRIKYGRDDHGATKVTARFEKWLGRRSSSAPFFCYLNYIEAHAPLTPESPFRDDFLEKGQRDTEWGRTQKMDGTYYNAGLRNYTPEEISIFSNLYDGAIAYQDWRLADTFEILRERGLLDRTLVIVTSDHGENFGERNLLAHQFALNNSLLHIPLIARLPGTVPAGVKADSPVENRLIGAFIDRILDASSDPSPIPLAELVQSLQGGDGSDPLILSELFEMSFKGSVWKGSPRVEGFRRRMKSLQGKDIKYVWTSKGEEELYDLANDPGELINLAEQDPSRLIPFREIIMAIEHSESTEAAPEPSEEVQEQLRALGYM